MVAILEKSEHNIDFHPIVDFVEASPLTYALTFKPTVYVSHIRQFWSSARIETTEEGTKILATIDGILKTVTESSLMRNLKLQDEEGISSLPDAELFENLKLMGYNISPNQKFTFLKGTPTKPHHTPSPKAQPISYTTPSLSTLLSVTTTPIPTVTLSDTPTLRQYTRRARIAQSSALSPVADEPASPLKDISECEAFPTDFGFRANQDRANIAKTSTLPHDSAPRVTSSAADEGKRFRDDAPIKGRNLDEGEAAAERVSDDIEDMATVLTSMDATTVLASGVAEVSTGSGSIPTGKCKELKTSEEVPEEVKSPDEVPEEKVKEMMQLVPIEEGRIVGNKMHKAFPLPIMEFPLPEEVPTASEESSYCQKKRDATAVKIALLLKSRRNYILGVTTNSVDSDGVEADVSNMETTITASPTPTLRIHKHHPKSQIIGPVDTPIQTKNKSKEVGEQSFIATIHQKTNPALLQFCLFLCFLSQAEPKKISDALQDPSWVLKNKKDEGGIVIRNKAMLVAQGHTQEEGIDKDEVFAPVARIKAIKLFLAYASFMGFTVCQMDVRSAFPYGTIDEEVGTIDQTLFIRRQRGDFIHIQVCVDDIIFGSSNPQLCREFKALMHENFQMSAMGELNFFLGLQVLQKEDGIFSSQDKYVGDIIKKFGYLDVRSSNTPMDKENR
nr:putative ribonuclease H-like domain-containing protein [Tanacetum cinerariifolium]